MVVALVFDSENWLFLFQINIVQIKGVTFLEAYSFEFLNEKIQLPRQLKSINGNLLEVGLKFPNTI